MKALVVEPIDVLGDSDFDVDDARSSDPCRSLIERTALTLLRTVCGLRVPCSALTCINVPIHTLKRNSTTSPSCMT